MADSVSNTETVFLSAIEPEEAWLVKARLLASDAREPQLAEGATVLEEEFRSVVEGATLTQGATALEEESEATHAVKTTLISERRAQAASERAGQGGYDAPPPQLKALKNGVGRRHAPPAVSSTASAEAIPLVDGGTHPMTAEANPPSNEACSSAPKRTSFCMEPASSCGSTGSTVCSGEVGDGEIQSKGRKAEFEFLGSLKQGTLGRVDKVKRKVDGKIFVCKTANLDVFKTEKERQQAIAEAKIMGALSSPYIVACFDTFFEGEQLHIIVQFCDRGDLLSYLAKTSVLPEGPIWKIFLRIANALQYLHANQVLHRDVKSENVFLHGTDEGVRLGDFGLSKILSSSQLGASTIVGSPTYFSPEQISGEGKYNEKCEVWALGVILYELCSKGHNTPFSKAKTLSALMKAIISEDPPVLPRHIADDMRGVCGMLLNKDPQRRPTVAELLAQKQVAANAKTHEAFLHKVPVTAANRTAQRSSSRLFDLLERVLPCVCTAIPSMTDSMTSETKSSGESAPPSFLSRPPAFEKR